MYYDTRAVTFVDNHDMRADYGVSPIDQFTHQAYAYILTRAYSTPKVFWKNYYQRGMKEELDRMIRARRYFAYGEPLENTNNTQTVYSYTRQGLNEVEGTGLVMIITKNTGGGEGTVWVNSGRPGVTYIDYTGKCSRNRYYRF